MFFLDILFNNYCQIHNINNKKHNKLIHFIIYYSTFSYLGKNDITIFSNILNIEVKTIFRNIFNIKVKTVMNDKYIFTLILLGKKKLLLFLMTYMLDVKVEMVTGNMIFMYMGLIRCIYQLILITYF